MAPLQQNLRRSNGNEVGIFILHVFVVCSSISMLNSTPKHYESQHGALSIIPQVDQTMPNMDTKMGMVTCATSLNTSASSNLTSFLLISLSHMEVSHKCHNLDISHQCWWCQGQHIFQIYPILCLHTLLQMNMSHKRHNLDASYHRFMSRALEPPVIESLFNRHSYIKANHITKDARRIILCFD